MGLSRLDNFLRSARGTIIYVDPNSIDSTDSIENTGTSPVRPFKSIQRALAEAARFSYQRGRKNDRFGKTTIILNPGDYVVDNRPGWIPKEDGSFLLRSSEISSDFLQWDLNTNFDVSSDNNVLYKLNSIYGGVIIPRGTSIVGVDLRKTRIRPRYVPNPDLEDGKEITPSCIFRLTGGCYLWQFTILDADPNGVCYIDYTKNLFVPSFSHHKLRAFEYADGVNKVNIKDDFITYSTDRTDLDIYYQKIGLAYGPTSGTRDIPSDYPNEVDIEPTIDEYRIVGPRGGEVGISSIRSGNGIISTSTITVNTDFPIPGLNVDTAIQIEGVSGFGYDGQYVVSKINSPTEFEYIAQNPPTIPIGGTTTAFVKLTVDTVTSSSPYIFNVSLKTVYGMCGLLADGDKADGFKSMVVAQFTGIGLQKDDRAFTRYDKNTGVYKYSEDSNLVNLFSDSSSKYRPEFENYHIKATNDAYIQVVSVFAIGFANHFVTENGGDMSINNSNSNFGSKGLVSKGYKRNSFLRDDVGYITHIISPQEIDSNEVSIEFSSIDVEKTIDISQSDKLYLYSYNDINNPPESVIDGYRIGAKKDDYLNVNILESGITSTYYAPIIMPDNGVIAEKSSFEKSFDVQRINAEDIENNIVDGVITFTTPHSFLPGESVRAISDNGDLPDGIIAGKIYYAITNDIPLAGIGSTQIKLAQTFSDAFRNESITPSKKGGILKIVSRVSDKNSGDVGHPIQWDNVNSQWYIKVSSDEDENTLYTKIVGVGTTGLGLSTPRTYIQRKGDNRNLTDKIYKLRYVIPKKSNISARPPLDSFIIQESGVENGINDNEALKYFDPTGTQSLQDANELRNPRYISTCTWSSSGISTITTELPHGLKIGNEVKIVNVTSTQNTLGEYNLGFNGLFVVDSVSSTKKFSVKLETNPGTFTNNTSVRNSSLPRFIRKKVLGTYQLYRSQEIQEYIPNSQDGIYHLIVTNASNSPTVTPFREFKFSQPIQNLYPQTNRDNPVSDPKPAKSYAVSDLIGKVVVNEPQNSITKETVNEFLKDFNVGIGLTNIISNSDGKSHTLYTERDHNLLSISNVSIVSGGSTYITGIYYNVPLVSETLGGKEATARVTVSAAGTISNVTIMDGGSAYGIGNTLAIKNVPRNFGSIDAIVSVNSISNNIGDCLSISGISDSYDTLYKIVGISTGNSKEIQVESSTVINNPSLTGLGITNTAKSNAILIGKTLEPNSVTYQNGLLTFSFSDSHGFNVNDKVRISGFNDTSLNSDFIIKQISTNVSTASTQFSVDIGLKQSVDLTGDVVVYPFGVSSAGGLITRDSENLSSRLITYYDGVTTKITSSISIFNLETDPIEVQNAVNLGLKMGDYIQINDEIFRIKSSVTNATGNFLTCFRAVLGTKKQNHPVNSIVKKIKVVPIEFRRNSIIRASGHTFEYMGFGSGNYSTSLPERQNRIISGQEELLSQSIKIDGGVSVFTGMNSDGDFYTGNKKVNSTTGEEELFDTPIPTVTGEDISSSGGNINVGFDVLSPLEINVNRSIRVEGGENGSLISEFDGPVIFNNKITSTSKKGIEASSLYLQGDATVSRKTTVGISTPIQAGNPGDVVINAFPQSGNFYGWVYTTNNRWEKFGIIGENGKSPANRIGISTNNFYSGLSTTVNFTTNSDNVTLNAVTDNNVGITTFSIDVSNKIGVSKDSLNNFVGVATQINFVGVGITVYSNYNQNSGIATIIFDGLSLDELPGIPPPGGKRYEIQYNDGVIFGGVTNSAYNPTSGLLTLNSSVAITTSTSTSITVTSSSSDPAVRVTQTGTGNAILIEDDVNDATPFVITNNGSIGVGINQPQAKLDISVTDLPGLRIRSSAGSPVENIVRIDNILNDTAPFIIDVNGNVGINTLTILSGIALDVIGNTAITGEIRIYTPSRSNYSGFKISSSLNTNLIWQLPTVAGLAGSVLYSVSPGILGWSSVKDLLKLSTTDDLSEGNQNLYFKEDRVSRAIVNKKGETCGIVIEYNEITGKVDYKVIVTSSISPFTTRGFALPI